MFDTILLVDHDPDHHREGISSALIETGVELARRANATLHILHCGSVLSADSSRRTESRYCRPFGSETHTDGHTRPTRRHDREVYLWFGYDWQTIATQADTAADQYGLSVVRSYYPLVEWSRVDTINWYVAQEEVDLVCTAAANGRRYTKYRGPTFAGRLRTALDTPVLTIPRGDPDASDVDADHADTSRTTARESHPRYKRLLITNSGLQFDQRLTRQALTIAGYYDATVHALYIGLTGGYSQDTMGLVDRNAPDTQHTAAAYESFIYETYRERGSKATRPVSAAAQQADVDIVTGFQLGEHTLSEPLLEYAAEQSIDLIVLCTYETSGIHRYVGTTLSDQAVSQFGISVLATQKSPTRISNPSDRSHT